MFFIQYHRNEFLTLQIESSLYAKVMVIKNVSVMPLCKNWCSNYGTIISIGDKKGSKKSTSYTSPDVVHKFFGRFNFARKKAILKTLLTALKRSLSKHIDIDLILRLKGLLLLLLHIAASNSA